jgi:CRISPR-associated protein Csy3
MSKQVFKKTPSVLAFQRAVLATDALIYSVLDTGIELPVQVTEVGIRGTQNINGSIKEEVRNLQLVDAAKTAPNTKFVKFVFGIKFIDIRKSLHSIASGKEDSKQDVSDFKQSLDEFLNRVTGQEDGELEITGSDGILDVATRYARNIANAKWLWRNRLYASSITTTVSVTDIKSKQAPTVFVFDSLEVESKHFDDFTKDEEELGKLINDSLLGTRLLTIEVSSVVDFGVTGVFEVFPSQLFIDTDALPKNKKGKFLYAIKNSNDSIGQAAIRDQKITNALRTIDTWYKEFDQVKDPIPVEPNGASLTHMVFFRKGAESSFDIIKRLNTIDVDSDEGKFFISALIRGGVYSS